MSWAHGDIGGDKQQTEPSVSGPVLCRLIFAKMCSKARPGVSGRWPRCACSQTGPARALHQPGGGEQGDQGGGDQPHGDPGVPPRVSGEAGDHHC